MIQAILLGQLEICLLFEMEVNSAQLMRLVNVDHLIKLFSFKKKEART